MSDEQSEAPSLLLEPEKKSLDSYILPAALALGAAALIVTTMRKKEKKTKSSSSKNLTAGANEVVFSSDFKSYEIGEDYEQLTLEPYLAEQAEQGDFYMGGGPGIIESVEKELMKKARAEVLSAFKATHQVKVGKSLMAISGLPKDRKSVQDFNAWLVDRVRVFQEEY